MKLDNERESENVEDRRGSSGGGIGGRSIGIGGVVVALIASYFLGIDPSVLLGMLGGDSGPAQTQVEQGPATTASGPDPQKQLMSRVLASTEDTWGVIFREAGKTYQPPKLTLFTRSLGTACGMGQSATGPFYCPGDEKVYIDLAFFQELRDRFKAPGDFAQAYVLAHEIGHHVQNILGTSGKVHRAQQRASESEGNALSVRLELQADCYAGVWAATAARQGILEAGDVEEGLGAASAVGDDRLQKMATGRVSPESWTHGSSAQRMEWFRRGFDGGDARRCDTFSR